MSQMQCQDGTHGQATHDDSLTLWAQPIMGSFDAREPLPPSRPP